MRSLAALLGFTYILAVTGPTGANTESDAERPCTKSDLIGTWVLDTLKNQPGLPESFDDLTAPYQARMYSSNGDFRQLSSSRRLKAKQTRALLSTTQNQTFELHDDVVITKGHQGQILEMYQCRFYTADLPRLKITKGTLSLLWFSQEAGPLVMHTYAALQQSSAEPASDARAPN